MDLLKNKPFRENIINVFIADLNYLKSDLPTLFNFLSYKEQHQATKFAFEYLKDRYVASHGLLRVLCGKYLSLHPSQVEFTLNECQKPFCKSDPHLFFNMSHSQDYACFAFSHKAEVGIDIEYINNQFEIQDLLPSIATPKEIEDFNTLQEADKVLFFYKVWTLKEAFLKALGVGLSHNPSLVETSLLPKDNHKIIKTSNISEKDLETSWSFSPIKHIPNYIGAVAINKKEAQINFHFLDSLSSLLW